MFNFFEGKNQSEEPPINNTMGVLSTYDIEDIYSHIPKERLNILLAENKPMGMGLGFKAWFESNSVLYGSKFGPLFIFIDLLQYFPNEINFHLYLFERSKKYNNENYYLSKKLSKHWENHLNTCKKLIAAGRYTIMGMQDRVLSRYWIEYHFFYMVLLDSIGNSKSDIKLEKIVNEIIDNYIENLDSVSARMIISYLGGAIPSNGVLWHGINFYEKIDRKKANQLIDLNNKFPKAWRNISPLEDENEEE